MLQIRSLAALEFASDSAEAILAGGTRYYHTNGDLSSKDESQRWSRKQSRHSRNWDGEGAPSSVNEVDGETPHGERNTAEQACTIHEGRTRHPSPEVRAQAQVALAALATSPDAARQLATRLDADAERAASPGAATTLREGAAALKTSEGRRQLRERATAAAKLPAVRAEFREAIRANKQRTGTGGRRPNESRENASKPVKSRLD